MREPAHTCRFVLRPRRYGHCDQDGPRTRTRPQQCFRPGGQVTFDDAQCRNLFGVSSCRRRDQRSANCENHDKRKRHTTGDSSEHGADCNPPTMQRALLVSARMVPPFALFQPGKRFSLGRAGCHSSHCLNSSPPCWAMLSGQTMRRVAPVSPTPRRASHWYRSTRVVDVATRASESRAGRVDGNS